MIETLDTEHDSIDAAALAALQTAEDIFKKRAKYTVVGQLWKRPDGTTVDPATPEAIKVALGWYSTITDAKAAAEALATNKRTGETYRVWVLDVFHDTPGELAKERKEKLQEEQQKRRTAQRERIQKQIEKRQQQAQERANAA